MVAIQLEQGQTSFERKEKLTEKVSLHSTKMQNSEIHGFRF